MGDQTDTQPVDAGAPARQTTRRGHLRHIVGGQESGLLGVIALLVIGLTIYGAINPKAMPIAVSVPEGGQAVFIFADPSDEDARIAVPVSAAPVPSIPGEEIIAAEVQAADGRVIWRTSAVQSPQRWRLDEANARLLGRHTVNRFFEPTNLILLANNASLIAVIAVGMVGVIILAGIDLSVGSIYALAGVLAASALAKLDPGTGVLATVPLALLVSCGIGALLGAANGAMIVLFRVHPFIITLGTMSVYRGLAFVFTEGQTIGGLPDSLQTAFFKLAPFGGDVPVHPINTLIMLLIALGGSLVLTATVFGRRVYAIGGNETAARYAGIPIGRIKVIVYTLVGALAGLSACMSIGYFGAATSSAGNMYELRVIAAAVVGGAALTGGRGTALGAVLGAIIIELINNAIIILGIDNAYLGVVTGAAIIVAVVIDRVKQGILPGAGPPANTPG
ncbi:MAG: ABC transporter permease [Planctomycetota bacterium]